MAAQLIENNRKIKVTTTEGEDLIIKPCVWMKLEDVSTAVESIVQELLEKNGAYGDLIKPSNRSFWSNVDIICSCVNVVNNSYLDVELIPDIDDILSIFVTPSHDKVSELGLISGSIRPSYISVIHGLDFFIILNQALDQKENKKEK